MKKIEIISKIFYDGLFVTYVTRVKKRQPSKIEML